MLRREVAPVVVDDLHGLLIHTIQVGGALGVDQIVMGVHVDPRLWGPGHDVELSLILLVQFKFRCVMF